MYKSTLEEVDKINRLLDSINNPTEEIDQKWIRKNETNEKTNAIPAQPS